MDIQDKDKKEYELAVLVKEEADLAPLAVFIRQHNAEMSSEFQAKKIAFAYEVKKQHEGIFAHCTFRAFGNDMKELEDGLNARGEVLRFLVIASPEYTLPSREQSSVPGIVLKPRRGIRSMGSVDSGADANPSTALPLSNEALEKKIEEILQ